MKSTSFLAAALAAVVSSACLTPPVARATLEGLQVEAPGERFSVGSAVQLEAFALYSSGERRRVTRDVAWRAGDEAQVLVGEAGLARLLKPGRATVTARLDGAEATRAFEVSAARARDLELLPRELSDAPRGLTPQLRLLATFTDGSRRDVTAEAEWSASGPSAQPLQEAGRFQLNGQGVVELIAGFGGLEARKAVRVGPPRAIALHLEALEQPLRPGEVAPSRTVATFTDGASRDVTTEATLRSLDPDVAQVQGASVLAVAPGQARLVVEYGGQQATRTATVIARQLVSLGGNLTRLDLPGGRGAGLRVIADFDDGAVLDVTEAAVWRSSEPLVAEVGDDGQVFARAQGFAEVTATFGARTVTFEVTALAPVLEDVRLSLGSARLVVGQRATFALYGRFSDGAEVNLSQLATLRSAPLVGVTPSGDLLELEALADGPASVEVELGGFIRTLPVEVVTGGVSDLVLQWRDADAGSASRALRAFARYDDGSSADVTELCDWRSSDPAALGVGTVPGQRGTLLDGLGGPADVSASMAGRAASVTLTP
ncbi:MAG: hypothetical protein INH41_20305 [Myxococcaceae bacterium]|jgi:hypothetical protein|nr:hypothetical protein [Myxococcaceae bacterium]MCA3014732.1 hypothetical protein [Myxococcaceae bacterium]